MASYGVLAAVLTLLLRRKRFRVRPFSPWNFALYALAAEHISRLISKDSVMSPVRKPFTEFKEPTGEGEVNEEVIGSGPQQAIGELLTCPFCLDQWVATGLVAGSVAAPTLTTAVVSVSALAPDRGLPSPALRTPARASRLMPTESPSARTSP